MFYICRKRTNSDVAFSVVHICDANPDDDEEMVCSPEVQKVYPWMLRDEESIQRAN